MSDIIQLLPESVANQIAAGEVVQRPASAVKELLENAIDAGADKIQLIVKDAGKSLIQVIDNGCGMSITDARMCFERHATSKIRKADDLFAIRTMGFRGEAMASIAAIAHVELKTRLHGEELGTCIVIEGTQVVNQEPAATQPGSSISVKNLFFNTPARRNFLKSNPVELRHIIEEFQRVALAHPAIAFSLHSDGNEVFRLLAEGLKQRIIHIFGNSYNQRLVPVEEETTIIRLSGFIGKPEFAKKTRGEQYFFINKRFVKDPYLNHAVLNAYDEILPADSYPLYVLFIEIDPAEIDINVHPTKTEIKYRDERSVYAIVRAAVKRSLGRYNITPTLDFDQETGFNHLLSQKVPEEIVPPSVSFNPDFNPFESERTNDRPSLSGNYSGGFERKPGVPQNWDTLYEIVRQEQSGQIPLHDEEREAGAVGQEKPATRLFFQLHNRFIISQIRSGFIVIDQQTAHERILYERFLMQLEQQQGASQQSLFPQTITLNATDDSLMKELLPDIQTLGFQVRPFGRNTYVVEGVPADIASGAGETQMLEQLLETYKNNHSALKLGKRESLARSLARNAAVKPGAVLSTDDMANLTDQLFACSSPGISVSGKPVILTFTLKELSEKFGY